MKLFPKYEKEVQIAASSNEKACFKPFTKLSRAPLHAIKTVIPTFTTQTPPGRSCLEISPL